MAFKTFTAGAVLTASDVNTYLAKQAVIVCTSTTRPSSPPEGMVIYETDTDKMLTYTTSTTGWVPPWNQPWGIVATTSGGTSGYAYSRSTSTQSMTTATDVTNATATFTVVANRLYKITGMAAMTHSAGSTIGSLTIVIDSVTSAGVNIPVNVAGANNDRHAVITTITTLSAGSHTIKMQAATPSGTLTLQGATGQPTVFMVEDIGPSGAPA